MLADFWRIREEQPLEEGHIAAAMKGLLEGIAALHARGTVHKGLKASHLFLAATGEVKIGIPSHLTYSWQV